MIRIIQADVMEGLAQLPDQSVHCVVTSPPYWGLRDYGVEGQIGLEKTPEEYVARMVQVFQEVWRVLRDDGTLWLNLGDCYASQGGPVKEEFKSILGCSEAMIKASKYDQSRNLDRYPGLKQKDLVGIPWRVAFALQADGWYLRSDIIWSKPNPMPESVTDRPTKSHEHIFLLTKKARYFYDADAVREAHKPDSLNRYEYGLHSERRKQGSTVYPFVVSKTTVENCDRMGDFINPAGRNRRTVWEITTQPFPEAHFATFPEALVEPCIKAGSQIGGTILDPFAGSGTVGKVARDLKRKAILIEINPAYVKIARERLRLNEQLFSPIGEVIMIR